MKTLTKYVKIANWNSRSEVEALGDVSSMKKEDTILTILSGRNAKIEAWYDEQGNGFEVITITLNSWE